ncbi:MAG: hypothetical protein ACI9J4_001622 [Paraglaciecola sp.]|jgi:hypothetical protein
MTKRLSIFRFHENTAYSTYAQPLEFKTALRQRTYALLHLKNVTGLVSTITSLSMHRSMNRSMGIQK